MVVVLTLQHLLQKHQGVSQSQWEPLPTPPAALQEPQDQVPSQNFIFQLWLSQGKRLDLLPKHLQVAGNACSLPGFPEAGAKGDGLCVTSQRVPPAAQSLLESFKAERKESLRQGTAPGSSVPSAGGQCHTAA